MKPPQSLLLLSLAGLWCASIARAVTGDPVDNLSKLSLEWVKLRTEITRIETDWATQRELLSSTVKAFEDRAAEMESKRDLLKAKTTKEREELEEQEIENRRRSDQLKQLESHLGLVGERLIKLRRRLPPRLSQALELPLRSLSDPNLPPGERMAHTMTVLNRCMEFNRTVTAGEEIVETGGDGKAKLLQTVYWGMSHAYAYDKTAQKVWYGSPGPEGWQWSPCNDSLGAIREMLGTLDEKAEPKFVAVPAAAGKLLETGGDK